jgi:8-oxo-dGTP pyrophosphatase MutT (NUDIX family)
LRQRAKIILASFPHDIEKKARYYKLLLPYDDRPHGFMLPESVKQMPWTDDFKIDHESREIQLQDSSNGKDTSAACSEAFSKIITTCVDENIFENIHGVHSEPIAILGAKYPVHIERFSAPVFGTVNRGAHLTAYCRTAEGLKIWVPRRSFELRTYAGMLDSTVAGGVRADESPLETITHEAAEEASIPEDMVRAGVRPVGSLSAMGLTGKGAAGEPGLVFGDVLFLFDLEVPEGFQLKPSDEEVKEFHLMNVDEVKSRLLRQEFKNNSAVVMIDFFIRHSIITPDNEKNYAELVSAMHRRMPIPITPESVV